MNRFDLSFFYTPMGEKKEDKIMNENRSFQKELVRIAFPVTLQCLLQSSFGVIDQIMTGQLGSISIAGIGMGSKFISLFTVLLLSLIHI